MRNDQFWMCRSRRGATASVIAVLCLVATMVIPSAAQAALTPVDRAGATVYLVNAETGRYLDGDRDGAVRQSLIPNEDDQWIIGQAGSSGGYTFRNVQKNRLLDADGANRSYDVNLTSGGGADTEWEIIENGDGTFRILNMQYLRWLDADDSSKGYNVDLTTQGHETDAHWHIALATEEPADLVGTVVILANAGTGRYLDVDADGGVGQAIAPSAGGQFLVARDSAGNFTLRSLAEDRLLTGGADVDLNGTAGPNSQWRLTRTSDGTYEVQNVGTGTWLDGDYANLDYNVDLTTDASEADGRWNVLVLDTDFGCVTDNLSSTDKMLACVSASDTFVHLAELQAIADANGGIRASGTPGYDLSVDYVAGLLQAAGLDVTLQEFEFSLYSELSSSITADGVAVETQTMSYSSSGSLTGTIISVDHDLGPDNMSSSGCEPEDFDGLDFTGTADIALIQRGACAFSTKAINATEAGAEAVIIFNQGNNDDRKDIIGGTLGEGVIGLIDGVPVLDVAYDDAIALTSATTVAVAAETEIVTNTTENIIADLPGRNAGNVVMAGAHLDSVQAGPGIQDNGSGSAALLTIALAMANNDDYVPENSLRFAWWGAEESGLIGSFEYIFNPDFGISDEDYAALSSYLNFDMIASPNYIYGVYDADQSTFAVPDGFVPPGSAALEDLFEAFYSIEDIPYEDTEFSGRSDYQAFIQVGIPASGLFTGAEGIKTDEQQALWGGTVGEQYDQCYHLACDTYDNVSFEAFEVNVDAVAYAIFNLAATTESVNGVVGAEVDGITPGEVTLDGPRGTFVEGGGHAVHSDHNHPE